MAQKLTESLVKKLSSLLILPFGKQLIVFIISLMPILESRGGLIAASIIKLDIVQSIIIAFIGNIIPLILIIFAFDKIYIFENLKDCVKKAHELSENNDTVLLSPACASWDMYKSYEVRGDEFISLVNDLK